MTDTFPFNGRSSFGDVCRTQQTNIAYDIRNIERRDKYKQKEHEEDNHYYRSNEISAHSAQQIGGEHSEYGERNGERNGLCELFAVHKRSDFLFERDHVYYAYKKEADR